MDPAAATQGNLIELFAKLLEEHDEFRAALKRVIIAIDHGNYNESSHEGSDEYGYQKQAKLDDDNAGEPKDYGWAPQLSLVALSEYYRQLEYNLMLRENIRQAILELDEWCISGRDEWRKHGKPEADRPWWKRPEPPDCVKRAGAVTVAEIQSGSDAEEKDRTDFWNPEKSNPSPNENDVR